MAISRAKLINELCKLPDETLEKLFKKYSAEYFGLRLKIGGGAGAAMGAIVGGPIGAGVGAVAGALYGSMIASQADSELAKEVREAVSQKDKLKLPDGFCHWVEDQKKKGEWLKFDV
jgi:uncharacterized membrane protein